jgi:hypothetical protein
MWKCFACVVRGAAQLARGPRVRAVFAVLGAAVLLAACVDSPRSQSTLAHRTEPLHVSGLFEVPDQDLDIQVYDHVLSSWTRFATVRTRAGDPVIDAVGRPYFRYAANVMIPQGTQYWLPHVAASRIEARVRVVSGERVLSTFGADAEACARRAHDSGKNERDSLAACADANAFSKIFVAACGGVGEPCCPTSTCSNDATCEAGLCAAPRYPAPIVRDYQVDLSVPTGYQLRNAALVMDDTTGDHDSERPLLVDARAEPGVTLELAHPNVERLTFDLAFWKPGVNRFFVRADAVKGEAHRRVESAVAQLNYELPRGLGNVEPGVFRLPATHFARNMSDCKAPLCKDRDGDGLNDLWENVALHQLRPRLMMDSGDSLFRKKTDVVRLLTSVAPIQRDGESYVLFASVITFSRDYGYLIGWDHPGDTEGFAMLFKVTHDAEGEALRWVASVAKGHACITCHPSFHWFAQEFADDGTPLVYVEKNKHGAWQSGRACREHAGFRCLGDRALRPDAVNVGNDGENGARALIDGLDNLAPGGPFGELAGLFPGDAVWTASRARVPGRFCGGAKGCTPSNSANMPGTMLTNLVKLFEQQKW